MEPMSGTVQSGEFVEDDDEEGRKPGVYITIRLDDPNAQIMAGRVVVSYEGAAAPQRSFLDKVSRHLSERW